MNRFMAIVALVVAAVIVVLLIGVRRLERTLVAPLVGPRAEAIAEIWPRLDRDIAALDTTPLFRTLARGSDAGPFLERYFDWQTGDHRDEAPSARLADSVLTVLRKAGDEWPSLSLADLGTRPSLAWMDSLATFDQWDGQAPVSHKTSDWYETRLMQLGPLLSRWMKVRFILCESADDYARAQACLSRLAQQFLACAYISAPRWAARLLRYEHAFRAGPRGTAFSDTPPVLAEELVPIVRQALTTKSVAAFPAMDTSQLRTVLPSDMRRAGDCQALHFAGYTFLLLRPYLGSEYRSQYAMVGQALETRCSTCGLQHLRDAWISDTTSLDAAVMLASRELGDGSSRRSALRKLPVVRTLTGKMLMGLIVPDVTYGNRDTDAGPGAAQERPVRSGTPES